MIIQQQPTPVYMQQPQPVYVQQQQPQVYYQAQTSPVVMHTQTTTTERKGLDDSDAVCVGCFGALAALLCFAAAGSASSKDD